MLFALHGAAVLQQEFLREHLGHLETSDVLIANCSSDLKILRGFFGQEAPMLCRLPLPVDTNTFRPRDQRECREMLEIDEDAKVVGFVGRLLPQRNLHHFLYMLAELKQVLSPRKIAAVVIGNYWVDYPVLNYGGADYQAHIGELIRVLNINDNLSYFPAGLSDDELAMAYCAMDILIHPTSALDENFGYVPLEAMACGTPVVGAAYGGLKETIGEGAFLMPTWTTRSGIRMDLIGGLESAKRLLLDDTLHAHISNNGIKRVLENYTEEVCGRRLCSAVSAAVSERRTGNQRPISLLPPPVAPEPAGLLPPLELPWEFYENAVKDYVSNGHPPLNSHTRLRLAAPVEQDALGTYYLIDPAWPARFCLDEIDRVIVERCRNVVSAGDLAGAGEPDWPRIKRLIDDGLLICSN